MKAASEEQQVKIKELEDIKAASERLAQEQTAVEEPWVHGEERAVESRGVERP